jgi:hypothetical protein
MIRQDTTLTLNTTAKKATVSGADIASLV